MTAFYFDETVPNRNGAVRTALLGASTSPSDRFTSKDVNKPVKLIGDSRYGLVSDGDDLEAVVVGVEGGTLGNGYSYGSVQRYFNYLRAEVTGSALSIGDTVVCAAQSALGTEQPYVKVKSGSGVAYKWRVVSLLGGTGQVGTPVLLEPINL